MSYDAVCAPILPALVLSPSCRATLKSRRLARLDHEIKHDGFRIIARRDAAGVRLVTRNSYNFAEPLPLIVEAIVALPASFIVSEAQRRLLSMKMGPAIGGRTMP